MITQSVNQGITKSVKSLYIYNSQIEWEVAEEWGQVHHQRRWTRILGYGVS